MSDSRRRSSRKNRNDELRDNEQAVAGTASARTTPSRKSSTRNSESPSKEKSFSNNFNEAEDEDEDEELDEEMDEEDEEHAMAEEARFMAAHRARAGGPGLGAMAGFLSNQSSRLKSLLGALREPDPSVQLVALSELANLLSMSTEDSIAGYMQTDAFVAELVNIMRGPNAFGEENPEMMLLACRCLANLMEALPSSVANIAYGGAIPVLCQKLLEIQYIDLAEQALSTLEKISKEYPTSIVREGGMAACLTYLDFFSTNVQRTAVNTAANCAKNIPMDSFPAVRDVIPTLQGVILGNDSKVVESGCLCLSRILESFHKDSAKLEELLQPGLLQTILGLLSPVQAGGNSVSELVHTRFLHVLGLAVKVSPKLACQMLQNDLIDTVYQLLTGLRVPSSSDSIQENSVVVLQALIHRPREQVSEILWLISEILPGLPEIGLFEGLAQSARGNDDGRAKMFASECPRQYEKFSSVVLPLLIDIYSSTVNIALRKTALVALLKLCYNLESDVMKRVVQDVPFAVFITGVLGARDLDLVLAGARIACILLDRVQPIYARKLAIEGCVAELEILERKYGDVANRAVEPSSDHAEQELENVSVESDEDPQDDDENEDDEADDDADTGFTAQEINEEMFSQSTESTEVATERMATQSIAILVGRAAKQFIEKYNAYGGGDAARDDTLANLERVAMNLRTSPKEAFQDLAGLFLRDHEISSYYLRSSGVLQALLSVLTDDNRLKNRQQFLETVMTNDSCLILISKLQQLLSRAERFEVSTSSSGDKRSANILAKQLRLKLVADDASDVPRPYRSLMVSIHAIATFKALDDYLRPRVLAAAQGASNRPSRTGTPSGQSRSAGLLGRAPEGLQGALAQLAAAGSSLPESIRERLVGLGVDTNALLGLGNTAEGSTEAGETNVGRISNETGSDEVQDAGPPVSVEVPSSGGKAIAKTAEGRRIPTPRVGTPSQSATKAGDTLASDSPTTKVQDAVRTKQSPMSYAAAVSSVPKDWHIEFEVNGTPISHQTTIYGAVSGSQVVGDASTHGRPLSAVYQVKFRKVPGPAPAPVEQSSGVLPILGEIPTSIEQETEATPILQLLDVLYAMNTNWKDLYSDRADLSVVELTNASFVNTKLTAKLNRQLEEPLIVASQCLPGWSQDLPRFYPFLFPFETRYLFLQSTSFGYSRSMTRWQSAAKKDRDDSRSFLGRLQRQKVRISRPRMLESAMKVMELYGSSPSVLEVEYFEEVGTGLGPTLEFYSTVSTELSKKKLNVWRDGESLDSSEYVFAQHGLFPKPLAAQEIEENKESTKRTIALFRTIGTFLARAMIDSRLVSISFNPALFRLLGDTNDLPPSIGAVYGIDKALGKSLSLIKKFADAFMAIPADDSRTDDQFDALAAAIEIDNIRIEDLGLDFTYPGLPEIELIPGGGQVDVTMHNVSRYLDEVIDFTLGSGISRQLAAFRDGFSQVFPYTALRAFTPAELTMIFGKAEEDWSPETLLDSVKADHGYTMDSPTIRSLVSILSSFNNVDRRDFLQFMTGSPKLPIGGFKSLTPQFTVVCKPHEAPLTADDYLPSVMTCVNYLKMPDYSTADILKTKLLTAIREGGGSFHLS